MTDRELPLFHLCRWAPWADPVQTYNTGHKQQWRVCTICNRADFRTLWWDKQTNNSCVGQAVEESRVRAAAEIGKAMP